MTTSEAQDVRAKLRSQMEDAYLLEAASNHRVVLDTALSVLRERLIRRTDLSADEVARQLVSVYRAVQHELVVQPLVSATAEGGAPFREA